MRFIFWIFILFFFSIFQVSFLAKFFGNFLTIGLVFLTVLSLSLFKKEKEAMILGAIAGFFLDIYSAHFFGLIMLSLALTSFLASWASQHVLTKLNPLVLMTIGFSATAVYYGLFSFFSWLSRWFGGQTWFIFKGSSFVFFLSQLLLNTFLFLGIFYLIESINGLFKPK